MRLTGLRSSDTRTGEPVATRPRRRAWIGVAAAVMALASGWGAATAQAATTSVFYDDINNVAADPNPFASLTFGAGNIAVGQNMMSSAHERQSQHRCRLQRTEGGDDGRRERGLRREHPGRYHDR